MRWVRQHAAIAPFGILAATALLTYIAGQERGNGPGSWETASDMVDLATVAYAAVAVLFERGVNIVFWALQKRRERIEARQRMLEQMREEARATGLAEGRAAQKQRYKAWLARVSEERGIPLEELLPPDEASE